MSFPHPIRLPPALAMCRRRPRQRGLGLIEVLVSLSIVSMLLVAVGTAYTASCAAIDHNDEFFRASQSARISLNQILTAIRRCDGCQVGEVANPADSTVTAGTLHLLAVDGTFSVYSFRDDLDQIHLIPGNDASASGRPIARNVDAASFTAVLETDPLDGLRHVTRVTVTLRTKVGEQTLEVSGSAVPRRNVRY